MEKKYVITRMQNCIFSFLLHGQKAVEIHCDAEKDSSILGNIYIGKIKNIVKNIEAAFVEIEPGRLCYLALSDVVNPVYTKKGGSALPQAGDELLVQVVREGIKSKAPAVTTNLTLHGKYLLLTTGNCKRSVSSKLPLSDRERLLDFLRRQPDHHNASSYGWLARTNAGEAAEELLSRDYGRLTKQYDRLMQYAAYQTCYSCLYRTPEAFLMRLLNVYGAEIDEILTDDETLHQKLKSYLLQHQPEDCEKLSFYEDALLPLKKLYSLEHQLEQALSERVWLNSGGYLVIQPTEALTVIDVNTGKCESGKRKEQTFLKINLEAASEIARQLRLRNVSGIVIVDFINMEKKESNAILMEALALELKKDPIRAVLVDMTRLSLVEITRMKKEKPLAESLFENR